MTFDINQSVSSLLFSNVIFYKDNEPDSIDQHNRNEENSSALGERDNCMRHSRAELKSSQEMNNHTIHLKEYGSIASCLISLPSLVGTFYSSYHSSYASFPGALNLLSIGCDQSALNHKFTIETKTDYVDELKYEQALQSLTLLKQLTLHVIHESLTENEDNLYPNNNSNEHSDITKDISQSDHLSFHLENEDTLFKPQRHTLHRMKSSRCLVELAN